MILNQRFSRLLLALAASLLLVALQSRVGQLGGLLALLLLIFFNIVLILAAQFFFACNALIKGVK